MQEAGGRLHRRAHRPAGAAHGPRRRDHLRRQGRCRGEDRGHARRPASRIAKSPAAYRRGDGRGDGRRAESLGGLDAVGAAAPCSAGLRRRVRHWRGSRMAKRRELEQTSFLYGGNGSFIEELYARYLTDPAAVDPSWRAYFDELEPENRALFERARAALGRAPAPPAAGRAGAGAGAGGAARRDGRQGADPRSSARDHADPRLPRARPSDRQARPAGPDPQRPAPRARLPHLRLHRRRPRPRVLPRLRAGPGEGHAAPDRGGPAARPTAARSASSSCTSRTRSRRPGSSRGSRARRGLFTLDRRGEARDPRAPTETEGFEQFLHVKFPGTKRFGLDGGESTDPGAGDDHPHRGRARRARRS